MIDARLVGPALAAGGGAGVAGRADQHRRTGQSTCRRFRVMALGVLAALVAVAGVLVARRGQRSSSPSRQVPWECSPARADGSLTSPALVAAMNTQAEVTGTIAPVKPR